MIGNCPVLLYRHLLGRSVTAWLWKMQICYLFSHRINKADFNLVIVNQSLIKIWIMTRNKGQYILTQILQSTGIFSLIWLASIYYSSGIQEWASVKRLLFEVTDYRLWHWLENQDTLERWRVVFLKNDHLQRNVGKDKLASEHGLWRKCLVIMRGE